MPGWGAHGLTRSSKKKLKPRPGLIASAVCSRLPRLSPFSSYPSLASLSRAYGDDARALEAGYLCPDFRRLAKPSRAADCFNVPKQMCASVAFHNKISPGPHPANQTDIRRTHMVRRLCQLGSFMACPERCHCFRCLHNKWKDRCTFLDADGPVVQLRDGDVVRFEFWLWQDATNPG